MEKYEWDIHPAYRSFLLKEKMDDANYQKINEILGRK